MDIHVHDGRCNSEPKNHRMGEILDGFVCATTALIAIWKVYC